MMRQVIDCDITKCREVIPWGDMTSGALPEGWTGIQIVESDEYGEPRGQRVLLHICQSHSALPLHTLLRRVKDEALLL